MKKLFFLALVLLKGCEVCPAQPAVNATVISYSIPADARFKALAQVESGNNDFAVGKNGELGRYQESKSVWLELEGTNYLWQFQSRYMTNDYFALDAAQTVMFKRTVLFRNRHHRAPTDFEWYLLWHRPARVLNPKPLEAARAQRFANLVKKLSTK